MGLKITVYAGIEKVPCGTVDEHGRCDVPDSCLLLRDEYTSFAPASGFESHFGNLDRTAVYSFSFREDYDIGAYSYLAEFRDMLAAIAGWDPVPYVETDPDTQEERYFRLRWARAVWESKTPGPLSLLINFSDCEGAICTDVCRLICEDLENIQQQAYDVWGGYDEDENCSYLDTYNSFLEAFRCAVSHSGVVVFN